MLDVMRKHSRSFIIYIFFGIIIAVFTVNFGPQSAGCTASTTYATKVAGISVSPAEYAYVMGATDIMQRLQNAPEALLARFRGQIMDQILLREILASEAHDMGFRIPDKEINDMIVKGSFLNLGRTTFLPKGESGEFDYKLLERYLKGRFGLTVKKFKEIQRRELLAEKVRTIFNSSVKASPDEVKADWVHGKTKVQLNYVTLSPGDFTKQVDVTRAMIKAFLAKNKEKVKKYYDANKTRFDKLPRQVRLRLIRFNVPKETGDTPDPGAENADAPSVKQRAQQVLTRIKGGEDFAKVAREVSQDADSRASGGLLSWRNADNQGLGDEAKKALAKLNKGQITALVETKEALLILKVIGFREGTLKLAQASEEIAEEMVREEESLEQAKKAADGYLKQLAGGKKFTELFDSADSGTDAVKPEDGQPRYKTTTSFARSGRHHVEGIGVSEKLSKVVFGLKKDQAAKSYFVVGQRVFLVACADKEEPDRGEWTKERDDLIQQFVDKKANGMLNLHVYDRCKQQREAKKIRVNRGFLVTRGYKPSKKDQPLAPYVECESLKEMPRQ